ncbi:MAG: sugar ABC transporter ATP-binding protein [Janthinobacterium lividum]
MQIVADNIARTFGSTRALSGVSLTLEPGLVHALVGENGAGKSTLLKILGGAERADSGTITIDGLPYAPRSLGEAVARGVGLVFQEITVNPSLTVAENIFAGQLRLFARAGLLFAGALQRRAQDILDGFGAGISVRQSLSSLDLGQWKCIEIARALSTDPRAVFLDESTAFLNHREVDAVLAAMRALKSRGLAVAFVSHHLAEVEGVADRLTILKDGRKVGDFRAGELDRGGIQSRMVGRELQASAPEDRAAIDDARPVLGFAAAGSGAALAPFDLTLRRGEIVGFAGLKGAGGERILELAAGVLRPTSGAMALDGAPYRPGDPAAAWARGVAYLPGDRTAEGLIVDASVQDNLVMADPPRRGPFFDATRAATVAQAMIVRLGIKTGSAAARSGSLSGGNLQKVVLGKCLVVEPRVLLLNNPTRGVDIGARTEIYRTLRAAAAAGLAILIVSEDLNELIGLAHRVLVMRGGISATSIEDPSRSSEDAIIRFMT